MSLGQIIRKRREELGMTLDEVSARVGFSKPYLSTIETGKVKNPPGDGLLINLEKTLQFAAGVLLRAAHIESIASDIRQEYESLDAENRRFRQFVNDLIGKKAEIPQLDAILTASGLNAQQDISLPAVEGLVPVINRTAAGYPADFNFLDYPIGAASDYIRCPGLADPYAFAMRVVGDSMQPDFKEGDIVAFSSTAEVHSGDDCFVAFLSPHESTLRQVFFEPDNQVRLKPRNEKYPPEAVEGADIKGIYRAVFRYEKL